MFRKIKKMLSLTLSSAILASTLLPTTINATEKEHKLVILHTNDLGGVIDQQLGYDGLAAYREQWEMEVGEDHVLLIDSGSALSGSELAEITEGQAIVDMMNGVGFDYFVPSVGEFSYNLAHSLFLMEELSATVLSSNFINETLEESAYVSYDLLEFDLAKIGIVGITAPVELLISEEDTEATEEMDTYTVVVEKEELYELVQTAVDEAALEGADFIIAVGNLTLEDSEAVSTLDVIGNTTGISLFLGGYTEELEENTEIENKDGDIVLLQHGGFEFQNVGEIVIDLETLEVTTGYVDENFEEKDDHIQVLITHFKKEFLGYEEEIVSSESGAKTLDLEKETEEPVEVSVKGVVTKGEPIEEDVKLETAVAVTAEVVEEPVKVEKVEEPTTNETVKVEETNNDKKTEELLNEIEDILEEVEIALSTAKEGAESTEKTGERSKDEAELVAETEEADETEKVEDADEVDETEKVEDTKEADETDKVEKSEKENSKTVSDKDVEYVEYVVKDGDTLSHIALEFLGNGNLWNDIQEVNSDTVSNPHLIFVGQVIMVPANMV